MAAIAVVAPPAPSVPPTLAGLPHDSMAHVPITVSVFAVVVSLVAVALRLYTRHRLLDNVGFDDVCAVSSLIGAVALAAATSAQVGYGLGAHTWDLEGGSARVAYFKLFYAQIIIYYTTLLLVKLTISWQYYRLVKQDNRYRLPYIAVILLVMGWSVASIFANVFICTPVDAFWHGSPLRDCEFGRGYYIAIGNIVSDFVLLFLPVPMVFRLNVKATRKISLLALFAIGSFACIVSVLRMVYLLKDPNGNHGGLPLAADITYASAYSASWTLAEVAAGVLGASAMTLQPLLMHWGARLRRAHTSWRRSSDGGGGQAGYDPTRRERLGSGPNDDGSKSSTRTPPVRAWEGSETELTRIDDADETETMRKVETQSHVGSMPTSPAFSPLQPGSPGGAPRRSRHDLDPRGLAVLVQTQCRAASVGDDTPPVTPTAEPRDATNRRSGQLGIQIKRAWSVREHRPDEGQ